MPRFLDVIENESDEVHELVLFRGARWRVRGPMITGGRPCMGRAAGTHAARGHHTRDDQTDEDSLPTEQAEQPDQAEQSRPAAEPTSAETDAAFAAAILDVTAVVS